MTHSMTQACGTVNGPGTQVSNDNLTYTKER